MKNKGKTGARRLAHAQRRPARNVAGVSGIDGSMSIERPVPFS